MPMEAPVDHIPLRKHRLLEFLERQTGPVTAKVASIDLDTRASTVTEMLERCAAQGLVEREANRRPRDYQITDTGRRCLESFRSGQDKSEPESAVTMESNVVPDARKKSHVQLLRGRVKKNVEKEEGLEHEREHTLELPTKQAKTDSQSEAVILYRARYELRSLRFFDSKDEVKARIRELEGVVGREAAEQITRLVSLEGEIRRDSDAETLRAVIHLRDALHLPASVFGFPAKDTDIRNAKETSTKNESWWD